jgi:hypothetical protein
VKPIRSDAELQFRKSQRWLLVSIILLFPIALLASKISNIVGSDLVFGVSILVFVGVVLIVSIWSFVSYCRWKRRHPFWFLSNKRVGKPADPKI